MHPIWIIRIVSNRSNLKFLLKKKCLSSTFNFFWLLGLKVGQKPDLPKSKNSQKIKNCLVYYIQIEYYVCKTKEKLIEIFLSKPSSHKIPTLRPTSLTIF